jgi:tripartite ATP-independent transporter DctM subunit
MAGLYAIYVIGAATLRPSIAPAYVAFDTDLRQKLTAVATHIAPLGVIIFLVIGVILLGWATPTESAALGAAGTAVLSIAYRDLDWQNLKRSLLETTEITVVIFWIIGGAAAFSQILAISGAGPGLVRYATSFDVPTLFIIILIMLTFLFLGCIMEQLSMLMVTIPILMPVILSLGVDKLWFGILVLITLEVAAISPPFGLALFVMKGVAPAEITMGDIYKSVVPFIVCNLVVLSLMIAFPAIALWLPSLQK